MASFVDSHGRLITLGAKIAAGGEGTVYHVQGQEQLVAKIYHQTLSPEQSEKLKWMAQQRTEALLKHTAWPVDVLRSANDPARAAGLTMPKLVAYKPIHELYSPRSRRQEFPHADWRFLIHVAGNVARAFASVHQHNDVIGDVNHGNVVVAANGLVKLIDCDSFQIAGAQRLYLCEVGVPEYTPPELQGQALAKTPRTPNHDHFGLAVLIFQLLMMGRHPFAGTFIASNQHLPLERAIKEFRFAYGDGAPARKMRQPPNTLELSQIPQPLANLFNRAFGQSRAANARPGSQAWIDALDELSHNLRQCKANAGHFYMKKLAYCPWCDLEKSGLSLFGYHTPTPAEDSFDPNTLWKIIAAVKPPGTAPRLPTPPSPPAPSSEASAARRELWQAWSFAGLALLVTLLMGATLLGLGSPLALLGAAMALGLATTLRFWIAGHRNLTRIKGQFSAAQQAYVDLIGSWQRDAASDRFTARLNEAQTARDQYLDLIRERTQKLQNLQSQLRERQLFYYLDSYRIANEPIDGISVNRKNRLRDDEIETAADITADAVSQVSGFGPHLTSKLLAWRSELEARFIFDSRKGVDARDIAKLDETLSRKRRSLRDDLEAAPANLLELRRDIERARNELLPQIDLAVTALAQQEADLTHVQRWPRPSLRGKPLFHPFR